MFIPGKDAKEQRNHSNAYVPYSFYDCHIPTAFPNVPMHWHSEFELDYVLRGWGDFTCGGERFLAGAGDIMFMPPNMLHSAYPAGQEELEYYALVFNPAMLGSNQNDRCTVECLRPIMSGIRRLPVYTGAGAEGSEALREAAQRVFSCAMEALPQPDLLMKAELFRVLWLLASNPETAQEPAPEQENGEAVRAALEYLLEHFREQVTISQLARTAHLSNSYFMGSFKRAVGLSAMEYLTQLRVNAACEALLATREPIGEIAYSVGFGNLSNFNRQFKRSMGCTPRAFRQGAGSR